VPSIRFSILAPLLVTTAVVGPVCAQQLPPVPVPPENPITEEKRVLGKILFFEEQLSHDNTVSCGTCHVPGLAGTDPRIMRHPGFDGLFGTDDDGFTSPGVTRSDAEDIYQPDPSFGFGPQATRRTTNPAVMAMYATDLFWDGRAPTTFVDPETGVISIAEGGALEAQALAPILSDVEMAHEGRDWQAVTEKLEHVRPMALATDLPPDMAAALAEDATYAALFARAFGDPAITAERLAFALATYERTLLSDETPWDRFMAGDESALTPEQQIGWEHLNKSFCRVCHKPPLYTDHSFRNIGLRPIVEDAGRREVTGLEADGGKFKVPTLRNVGLKTTFMHNGMLGTLEDVLDFYLQLNGHEHFTKNQDSAISFIELAEEIRPNVIDFMRHGLTDPRVAGELFPFDRPTLHSERAIPNPEIVGAGLPGTGGHTPVMIAVRPPNIGNLDFRIAVAGALGGADAWVAMSSVSLSPQAPVNGALVTEEWYGPIRLAGIGAGEGYATWAWPIPDDDTLRGRVINLQWFVSDPAAPSGRAASPVARLRLFCHGATRCDADIDGDGHVALADLITLLAQWGPCPGCAADIDSDGAVGLADLIHLLAEWGECA